MTNKSRKSFQQVSAPAFSQIAPQQPPHNPYYPELPLSSSQLLPPPPYSDNQTSITTTNNRPHQQVAMSREASGPNINYARYHNVPTDRAPRSIVIHQVPYNARLDRHSQKVKRFNDQLLLIAIIAAISSYAAYTLFEKRNCLFNFVVDKPSDVEITIKDVKNAHLQVVYGSALIIVLWLIKSSLGYQGKSHGCYLFLMSIFTLIAALFTGYLSYLAFYSPCTYEINEILSKVTKKLLSIFNESLPPPDKGVFGEPNVFHGAKDDVNGVVIFMIDVFNCALYLSAFLTSAFLC